MTDYHYFEKEGAYFRARAGWRKSAVDDVRQGNAWVPYKGDRRAPCVYGDEVTREEAEAIRGMSTSHSEPDGQAVDSAAEPHGGAAHRAAGQAVAAILHGIRLREVESDGISTDCDDRAVHERSRGEVLADAAIGLAGMRAAERFSWGWADSFRFSLPTAIDPEAAGDFIEASRLVEAIDPDGRDDLFFMTWRQTLDLIGAEPIWRAIEAIAAVLITGRRLDEREVVAVFQNAISTEAWPPTDETAPN